MVCSCDLQFILSFCSHSGLGADNMETVSYTACKMLIGIFMADILSGIVFGVVGPLRVIVLLYKSMASLSKLN